MPLYRTGMYPYSPLPHSTPESDRNPNLNPNANTNLHPNPSPYPDPNYVGLVNHFSIRTRERTQVFHFAESPGKSGKWGIIQKTVFRTKLKNYLSERKKKGNPIISPWDPKDLTGLRWFTIFQWIDTMHILFIGHSRIKKIVSWKKIRKWNKCIYKTKKKQNLIFLKGKKYLFLDKRMVKWLLRFKELICGLQRSPLDNKALYFSVWFCR